MATTGTPTASASTAACGKFSQALEITQASARGENGEGLGARKRSEEGDALAAGARGCPFLEPRPVGAVADDREPRLGHPGDGVDRDVEVLLPRQPADEHERPRLQAASWSTSTSGAGLWSTVILPLVEAPGGSDPREVALGTTIARARAKRAGAGRLE